MPPVSQAQCPIVPGEASYGTRTEAAVPDPLIEQIAALGALSIEQLRGRWAQATVGYHPRVRTASSWSAAWRTVCKKTPQVALHQLSGVTWQISRAGLRGPRRPRCPWRSGSSPARG